MPTSTTPTSGRKKRPPSSGATSNRSVTSTTSSKKRPVAKKKKPSPSSGNSVATSGSKKKKQQPQQPVSNSNSTFTAVTVRQPSSRTTTSQRKTTTTTTTTSSRRDDNDRDRNKRYGPLCGFIMCCICIVLIVILILLFVVFEVHKNDNGDDGTVESVGPPGGLSTPAPVITMAAPATLKPGTTIMPVVIPPPPTPTVPQPPAQDTAPPVFPPNLRPTFPPVVAPTSLLPPTNNRYVLVPFADTVVMVNGFDQFEAFGSEDTFLVQNGPRGNNIIPDAFALLGFDMTELPNNSNFNSVTLRLFHQPATRNRGAATLTVRRLPSTRLSIETLHGGFFTPADDAGIVGPTFSVSPSDTIVSFDVTSLINSAAFNSDDNNPQQILLMIENRGPEQIAGAEGDRFYSRETDDPPQLVFGY